MRAIIYFQFLHMHKMPVISMDEKKKKKDSTDTGKKKKKENVTKITFLWEHIQMSR